MNNENKYNVDQIPNSAPQYSIVILTYNRETYLKQQLESLANINDIEIIIVDNFSDENYAERIARFYSNVKVMRLDKNYGAVGRNFGIAAATAPYIVTLDDDVWGITADNLETSKNIFDKNSQIDCICFHVIDEQSKLTTNWIHHCDREKFASREFETYEISEGAAIFRKECFERVGLYPETFFISHEGPDMAFRIINSGHKIIYTPKVDVIHAHAKEGRPSWRRYYYDTRNLIWLAYRNYNKRLIVERFSLQLAAMFLYSLRDGYMKYFFKALFDGCRGLNKLRGSRSPVSNAAYARIKLMDKNRPSLLFYIKERLFKKEIKI